MMGEQADYITEQGEGALWGLGGALSCRCCKESGFHWAQLDSGKWVLADNSCRIHECLVNPLRLNDEDK